MWPIFGSLLSFSRNCAHFWPQIQARIVKFNDGFKMSTWITRIGSEFWCYNLLPKCVTQNDLKRRKKGKLRVVVIILRFIWKRGNHYSYPWHYPMEKYGMLMISSLFIVLRARRMQPCPFPTPLPNPQSINRNNNKKYTVSFLTLFFTESIHEGSSMLLSASNHVLQLIPWYHTSWCFAIEQIPLLWWYPPFVSLFHYPLFRFQA